VLSQQKEQAGGYVFAGMSFQPSDFVKYALIINLAYMLSKKKDYISSLYYSYLPMIGYVLVVVALIAAQPNFSTASVVFAVSMMMFYVGNVKIKHMAVTCLSMIPAAGLFILSKPYILQRLFHMKNITAGPMRATSFHRQ